jgi:hypothetical protein
MDDMRLAAVGRHADAGDIAREHDQPIGLDERVEHEGASSLPLAIAAMTTMHEHRR